MTINTTANRGYPWPDNAEAVANGWDAIRDLAVAVDTDVQALMFRGARCYLAAQNLNSGVSTNIPWTAEDYDVGGFHDNAVNNSRLTVPAGLGGYYRISASLAFGSGFASTRIAGHFLKNGAVVRGSAAEIGSAAAGTFPALNFSTDLLLVAGDYVEVLGYQDSGAARALDATKTGVSISRLAAA